MATVTKDHRWTLEHPELGTGPVPTYPYVSKEYFERERDKIFKRTWLNVGRVEEISEPGDYFVKEIALCNASILIVRGKDGVVRGFHNVCRHRATKLVWDEHFDPEHPHLRFFTKNTLSCLVRKAGFECIVMATCGMNQPLRDLLIPTNLLLKAIKNP